MRSGASLRQRSLGQPFLTKMTCRSVEQECGWVDLICLFSAIEKRLDPSLLSLPPLSRINNLRSPLDPLLASLAHFSSTADLTAKIDELFYMIDANGNGTLNYEEIRSGLLSLEGCPIRLSLEDLDRWVNFEERRLRAEIWREGAGNKLRAQYILRAPCRVALGICSRRRVRSNSSKSVPDFGITMRGCKT